MSYTIEKWLKKKHKIRYADIDATGSCENCGRTKKLVEMVFWQNRILCTRCFCDELKFMRR